MRSNRSGDDVVTKPPRSERLEPGSPADLNRYHHARRTQQYAEVARHRARTGNMRCATPPQELEARSQRAAIVAPPVRGASACRSSTRVRQWLCRKVDLNPHHLRGRAPQAKRVDRHIRCPSRHPQRECGGLVARLLAAVQDSHRRPTPCKRADGGVSEGAGHTRRNAG
jgi:hypothetical protein